MLQNIRIYTLNIFKIDDTKKTRKNKKPHSAKLKMKLQLTSAQVGPPLYAFAIPPKKPKESDGNLIEPKKAKKPNVNLDGNKIEKTDAAKGDSQLQKSSSPETTPAPAPTPIPSSAPAPTPAPSPAPKPTRALNDPRYKSE